MKASTSLLPAYSIQTDTEQSIVRVLGRLASGYIVACSGYRLEPDYPRETSRPSLDHQQTAYYPRSSRAVDDPTTGGSRPRPYLCHPRLLASLRPPRSICTRPKHRSTAKDLGQKNQKSRQNHLKDGLMTIRFKPFPPGGRRKHA